MCVSPGGDLLHLVFLVEARMDFLSGIGSSSLWPPTCTAWAGYWSDSHSVSCLAHHPASDVVHISWRALVRPSSRPFQRRVMLALVVVQTQPPPLAFSHPWAGRQRHSRQAR